MKSLLPKMEILPKRKKYALTSAHVRNCVLLRKLQSFISVHVFPYSLGAMQIFVRAQETHVVDVDSDTTAWDVKCLLESREGLSPNSLLLKFAGQPLEDEVQLSSFLLENVTVDATVRLPGGRHGVGPP